MNPTAPATPDVLRERMVDYIVQRGHARAASVQEALRVVPRHKFVPAVSAEEAYANQAVITKRAADGAALSCASVPTVVAMMLDQLDVQPGHRVLEIGAGTGYNAALLAHLVGPSGHVTTVDIDPEVTAGTRRALDATGYNRVHVATRDGVLGDYEHAPYDRIIVTAGAWDIPPAWWEQLLPGGRLIVPLRWRGQTRSVAFVHGQDRLRSDSVQLCGFVPVVGQDGERQAHLDANQHVTLYWDADQSIEPDAIRNILDQPKASAWSGVTVGVNESFDGIWLRLTSTEPGTCRITVDPAAVETGRCTPAIPSLSPALIEGCSLAYLALRPVDHGRWVLGAHGHGPVGDDLAERMCAQTRAWHQDRNAEPDITAYPTGAPVYKVTATLIDKPHSRVGISWPTPG